MTSRTPQCKVFWPFNMSSEFSGVPEDSKFPLSGVWASPSHLAQSGVAIEQVSEIIREAFESYQKKKIVVPIVPRDLLMSEPTCGDIAF
jgi:hypothetical protein